MIVVVKTIDEGNENIPQTQYNFWEKSIDNEINEMRGVLFDKNSSCLLIS